MKNIFYIWKTDVMNIIKNPAALVVIGALCFLPSLYAWFNIWASWDPYSNTKGVKVAVVSEDEGATIQDKEVNVGNQVTVSLSKNDQMGWTFVKKDEAIKGVKHGDYYAAIIIPKDFSKDLTGVINKDVKKPRLEYYINEKVNAVSPKVTNSGVSSIVENIKVNFAKEVNKTVLTVFNDLGVQLENNHVDIDKIRNAVFKLEEDMPDIYSKIKLADRDLDLADLAADRVEDSLERADEVHDRAKELNQDLVNRMKESRKNADDAINSITKQLRGVQKTFQEVPKLTNEVSKKGEDLDDLIKRLRERQDDLDAASNRLQDVYHFLNEQDQKLKDSTKIQDIQRNLNKNEQDLRTLKSETNQLIKDLKAGKHPAVSKIQKVQDRADRIGSSLDGLVKDYHEVIYPQLNLALDQIGDLAGGMSDFFDRAKERNDSALKTVQDLRNKAGQIDTDGYKNHLEMASGMIETNLERVNRIINVLGAAQKVTGSERLANLQTKFKDLQSQLKNAQSKVDSARKAIEKGETVGKKMFDDLEQSLKNTGSKITDAQKSFDTKTEQALKDADKRLKDADKRMQNRFDQIDETRTDIRDMLDDLEAAAKNPKHSIGALERVVKGADRGISALGSVDDSLGEIQKVIRSTTISKEIAKIHDIQDRLQDAKGSIDRIITRIDGAKESGADALARVDQKAARIDDSLEDMIDFVNGDLKRKYDQTIDRATRALTDVSDVLDEVNGKIPKVRSVLEKARDGIGVGKDKLALIDEKFPEAQDAVNKAAEKIRDLEKKGNLDELIDLLRNDPARISKFLAEPIHLDEHKLYPIPNYGSAMNAFYTTLSLWVGGLLLVSSLRVDVFDKERFKSYEVYLGRLLIFSGIGIIQATIVTLGNLLIMKTFVVDKWEYVLFGILISFVFVSIVYTLVSVFGNTGKVLAIVLMVMQLGGSGGTFPIQMAPKFFQNIHAYLPFTHAISLLREAVGGIIWEIAWKRIIALLLYFVAIVIFGIAGKKFFNRSSDKFMKKAEKSKIVL